MYSSNPFGSANFGGGGSQNSAGMNNSGNSGGGDLSGQILTTVKQDMESVEKSGQWVFSCYSPAKVGFSQIMSSGLAKTNIYCFVFEGFARWADDFHWV